MVRGKGRRTDEGGAPSDDWIARATHLANDLLERQEFTRRSQRRVERMRTKARALRPLVIGLYGSACYWCKKPLTLAVPSTHHTFLTIDHVVPLRDGGGSGFDNLVPACRSCNNGRNKKGWIPPNLR